MAKAWGKCMRSFPTIAACCIAASAALAAPKFEDCRTLDECLAAMDADAHSRSGGSTAKQDDVYRARLESFGEPAKRVLLARASGDDSGWRNVAGAVLMDWKPLGPEDVPALIAALKKDPGGWVARPLGRIATPEALAALAQDVRLHGKNNQSGSALGGQGRKAVPYLLPMLEADTRWKGEARWEDIATLIADMKGVDVPGWVATALDAKQPEARRIGALRVIAALGSKAKDHGPKLRVLLDDGGEVSEAAELALKSMGDESVIALGDACRTGDAFWEDFQGAMCLSNTAAYGAVARPFAPAIFQAFATAPGGADRANAASFAGAVGYTQARARLVEMLDDPDWRAVYAAVRALGWLGAKQAVPALEKVAKHHWLDSVRDEAAAVVAALNGPSGKLAAPVVRPGRLNSPPDIQDFDIDATMAPDVAPCRGERWVWHGATLVPPPAVDRQPTLALPDGKLEGIDRGEFGGELDWVPRSGAREAIHRGNIDGLAPAPGGAVAVTNAGGIWREYEPPGAPPQVAPTGEPVETIVVGNGGGGNGFVFRTWRDASGAWRMKEIARLPRSADAFLALGPERYVAWSGNRAIVLSPKGIEGVAECAAAR